MRALRARCDSWPRSIGKSREEFSEVRGDGHSSSRSRGGRRGVNVVMADSSDGINNMVCGKGQNRDCDTARLSTSGLLLGGILVVNQLPGFEEHLSSGTCRIPGASRSTSC